MRRSSSVVLFLVAALAWAAPSKPTPTPCASSLAACHDDDCKGSHVDPALNHIKNRTDDAPGPEEWTLADVKKLIGKPPAAWNKSEPRQFPDEGKAVVVTGFLMHAAKEKGESCNCNLTEPDTVDWHLNLVSQRPSDATMKDKAKRVAAMKKSVVVEMTPRLRGMRPGWDWDKVNRLQKDRKYVRVTGFLLLDTMHTNVDRLARATAWEVHPIVEFDVCTTTKANCDGGSDWESLASFTQ
jgi:hypothetical protein